ncbi:chondroitinase family polysaccharide lyase [uncultured Carboxylicivirga sp.]|nr:chondroitinase family polysaccharide lyase [uncultured Carboxylicivirga sp.]
MHDEDRSSYTITVNTNWMRLGLIFLFIIASCSIKAQNYLGLEASVPNNWSATDNGLSISSRHYKLGSSSVMWNWSEGAQINIESPAGMTNALQEYKGGMMLWVYNEDAKNADLQFQFKNAAGQVHYHFNYHINFTGWRACWLRFDEDMFGSKADKDLTRISITAPEGHGGGTLFFDRMKFPDERVNDRVTPDAQLDYINPDMNHNHWAALWYWQANYQYDMPLPASLSAEEISDLDDIRQRITVAIEGSAPTSTRINQLRDEYDDLQIQRTEYGIVGTAFVSEDEHEASNNDRYFDEIDDLLYDIAKAWHHNQEVGFDQLFINILDWLYDQGLTVGSGLGTNHHYGYQFRGFPKAIWLMQDALKDAGKFNEAFEMIQYWTGVPEIRQAPDASNFQGIVDAWNTIINGRLMAIMLRDNSPELLRDMQSFARWMNASMQHSVGVMGGFKPDGAGFHHGMIYAGYMNGGYGGLSELLSYVGNTIYNLSDEARANFRQALDVHAWYANHRSIVNSVCGRKPMDQELGTGAINGYAYLAKATDPIDADAASQYMRLTKYKKDLYNEFNALGIKAASAPTGNMSINYGALNLHRRDNWLVAIKGFNKIVTGTEIYSSNNRYGRYQSYGTVQILASGSTVSAVKSGFVMEGWDWSRFPGATTIHLPYDLLDLASSKINERSLESDFAGACSQDGNGAFGMLLNENGHTNYTDDFVARKSVFAFDKCIICLGSNITNSNATYNTETTLFQAALTNTSESIVIDANTITQFPFSQTYHINNPITVMDTKGQGYYVPEGTLKISKSNQESRNDKNRSINNGDFATAWIDHGKAPGNAGYEFAILVQTNNAELTQFKNDMDSDNAPYEVIQKDRVAHVVKDHATSTTAHVIFEANTPLSSQYIASSNFPCIIMVKNDANGELKLSFADPSINMPVPDGLISDDEVKERLVQVTLNGNFSLSNPASNCRVIDNINNTTILEFTAIHGLAIDINLQKNTSATLAGEDDSTGSRINVYPNPVSDYLNYNQVVGASSVSVLSLDGQSMLHCEPNEPIYVGVLKPGMYVLQVNYKNKKEFVRFVKA